MIVTSILTEARKTLNFEEVIMRCEKKILCLFEIVVYPWIDRGSKVTDVIGSFCGIHHEKKLLFRKCIYDIINFKTSI